MLLRMNQLVCQQHDVRKESRQVGPVGTPCRRAGGNVKPGLLPRMPGGCKQHGVLVFGACAMILFMWCLSPSTLSGRCTGAAYCWSCKAAAVKSAPAKFTERECRDKATPALGEPYQKIPYTSLQQASFPEALVTMLSSEHVAQ